MSAVWVQWVADALAIGGMIVMTAAIYGMIWLPDLYTKLHAAAKGVVLGVLPILVALMASRDVEVITYLILIGAILLLTTPVAAHAVGLAGYRGKEMMETPDVLDETGRVHR